MDMPRPQSSTVSILYIPGSPVTIFTPRSVMANLLELSMITNSPLQHMCHRLATNALDQEG